MTEPIAQAQESVLTEVNSFLAGYNSGSQADFIPLSVQSDRDRQESAPTKCEVDLCDLADALASVGTAPETSSAQQKVTFTDVMKAEKQRITGELSNKLPELQLS